jgi:hypothetical protein
MHPLNFATLKVTAEDGLDLDRAVKCNDEAREVPESPPVGLDGPCRREFVLHNHKLRRINIASPMRLNGSRSILTQLTEAMQTPGLLDSLGAPQNQTLLTDAIQTPGPLDSLGTPQDQPLLTAAMETPGPLDSLGAPQDQPLLTAAMETPGPLDSLSAPQDQTLLTEAM